MRALLTGVAALTLLVSANAKGYDYFRRSSQGTEHIVRWPSMPVRYSVIGEPTPIVTMPELRQVVADAFNAWASVSSAMLSFESVENAGEVTLSFGELPAYLGYAYVFSGPDGVIRGAHVTFADDVRWSVAPSGESGRSNLRAIARHEIGHVLGLAHSPIGLVERFPNGDWRTVAAASMMFPDGFLGSGRNIAADDIAGVSQSYPIALHTKKTGGIEGHVTRNGQAVAGAHVLTFDPDTGALVGGFARRDGRFSIGGLLPGPKVVRVESIVEDPYEYSTQNDPHDFPVTYLPRLIAVQAGSTVRGIDIEIGR